MTDTPSAAETDLAALVDRARALARGRRALLGVVGAPGSGKSTVGAAIVDALGADTAVVVPMDGFHLANRELARLDLAHVKGNVATFDADGYAHLLQRLRSRRPEEIVYAPAFDRDLEESIGSAIPVPSTVSLIVTEGNYLLSDGDAWARARACLDETWFLDTDPVRRVEWLVARHIAHGRSPEAAREWVTRSDEANARFIETTAHRADLRVRLPVH